MKYNIIIIRHGQSTYNLENKFTGWKDVELTNQGINEAKECAKLLKSIKIDVCYTSLLKRASQTMNILLEEINQTPDIYYNQSLNERDYGDLVGKNKADTAKKYGTKQVELWRRSYNIPPPNGESLEMTCNRVIPYFNNHILKNIKKNNYKNTLISAHGNSIRAIVMKILNYNKENILKTEIGWCEPWIFNYNEGALTNLEILERKNSQSMSHLPDMPNLLKKQSHE